MQFSGKLAKFCAIFRKIGKMLCNFPEFCKILGNFPENSKLRHFSTRPGVCLSFKLSQLRSAEIAAARLVTASSRARRRSPARARRRERDSSTSSRRFLARIDSDGWWHASKQAVLCKIFKDSSSIILPEFSHMKSSAILVGC